LKLTNEGKRAIRLTLFFAAIAAVTYGVYLFSPRAAPIVCGALILFDFWGPRR